MLTQIADGVFVHESDFIQSNSVVVRGRDGVLVIDPGLTHDEMTGLADDIRGMSQRVVAGFATHPDWDHVLWHAALGEAPRYGTALCAATMAELLAQPDWPEQVAVGLPPEYADEIPLDLFGEITALPRGAVRIPWDGPTVRIIEHRAHAAGHAALLVEERGILVAGDMLSDILMPFLDVDAAQPLEDYLTALQLFQDVADDVRAVVPGHGSVGTAGQVRERIEQDRAYVQALRDGALPEDERVGPSAPLYWLADVHRWQLQRLAEKPTPPSGEHGGR
ncbi:MBL fold metallo-hydrolase [Microbacterium lushaniae]|uniref:MBL fold metallo-hydrolase n=1 Tax=Microbacterium lushaniae TaxID=2614639 RepID=A0A5J6L5R2_9MICO|nr:MBL fold metallo-hydrolase [Microbacterium lushaniae]QEW03780.1 MBL fold metallo-hydrolase [Microbacterium lushaniae]